MAEKAIQIAPKSDIKIKEKVSRKLNKKHLSVNNPIVVMLISFAGIAYIFPALFQGVLVFFGVGFKAGMEAAIKMYDEGMRDTKRWAR